MCSLCGQNLFDDLLYRNKKQKSLDLKEEAKFLKTEIQRLEKEADKCAVRTDMIDHLKQRQYEISKLI